MRFEERLRSQLSTYVIMVGILVLVNIISVRTFFRLDLSKNQAYSLSKVSKQYMRDLKDPLVVKAFFSKRLPPPYNANARYLRDMLEDYRTYSGGRFNYQFIDPADDPMQAREARSLGVYEIQLTAIEKDKFEQKNGYMGLALTYRDRKEVIPLVQDTTGLEYQISSMIKKLTQQNMKVLGVTQGYGEPAMNEQLSNMVQILSKNYEVVPVNLAQGGIPARLDALLVAGPTQPMPEDKLYWLDQFLRSGKSIAMLVPMIKADARVTMQGQPVDSRLTKLTAAWGVNLQPNLVYDAQCQKIQVAQRGPGFIIQNIVPYPPFPLVTEMDRNQLIVKNIEGFTLPFVSSLTLQESILKANQLQANVLAKSSKHAWAQMSFFMLSPQYIQPPQPTDLKQFDLMATLSGKFPSAFAANAIPATTGEPLPPFLPQAAPSRLLVVGSADFITNDFVNPERNDSLVQIVQNLVDWIAQDSALVEIRSKGAGPASMPQLSEAKRTTVKYFNLFGLPLLVVGLGLVMWRRMKTRRLWIASQVKR